MRCAECGTQNPEGARFCMKCGRALPEPPPVTPVRRRGVAPVPAARTPAAAGGGLPVKALLIGLAAAAVVAVVAVVLVLTLGRGKRVVMVVASPTTTAAWRPGVVTPVPPAGESPTPGETPATPTITPTPMPTPTPTPVPPIAEPTPSLIAFRSERDGNAEIYVMKADGSGQVNLTQHGADDRRPSMSPDGSQIAFDSDRDGNWEIYVMNADGTGLARLTDAAGWDGYPVWSPDGAHLAFVRDMAVMVMDRDGSNQAALTGEPWADVPPISYALGGTLAGADLYPTWMPDPDRIVFLSVRDYSFQFYAVGIDGTGLAMVDSGLPPSEFTQQDTVYLVQTGLDQTYLFPAGGVSQQMNDTGLALGEFPAWSPDGTQIAFHSNRDGNMEIYVLSADRSRIVRLTHNEANDVYPTWSPDGTQIAFTSDRDGNLEIYVMNADGSGQTRLTDNPASDYTPSWYR